MLEFEEQIEHDDDKGFIPEFLICVPSTELILEPLPTTILSTILPLVSAPEPLLANIELRKVREINENEDITFVVPHLMDVETLFEAVWHNIERKKITIEKSWPNPSFEKSHGSFFLNDIIEVTPSTLISFVDF